MPNAKTHMPNKSDLGSENPNLKIVLLYERQADPDGELLTWMEGELARQGYRVVVDRETELGVEWARRVESEIRTSDVVIPLLSEQSVNSELLGNEVEYAHEAAGGQGGRPWMVPVRVNYTGPLPGAMGGILNPLPYLLWEGGHDNDGLMVELGVRLRELPKEVELEKEAKGVRLTSIRPAAPPKRSSPPLEGKPILSFEPIGGAVPLHSEFYVSRPADGELAAALNRYDSIVLIKGARQIGKTSLLARGLAHSRERGAKVALTDFQKFNASNLESVGAFYLALAESLADQLDVEARPAENWDPKRGANANFERFMRRQVLGRLNSPLVWGLDEVDRLFVCPFGSEVFGLFRSWHNERALDPSGPWAGLTLLIAYATEAHLFISDMNQSPFNVGTRLELEDFDSEQVAGLNKKYRGPLKDETELGRFMDLVAGHPFLVRRGLSEMAAKKMSIDVFEIDAIREDGVYGDHLRRIIFLLAKDLDLTLVLQGVLRGQPCSTPESFWRLRSAGIVKGTSQNDVRPRCQLYAKFLMRHLG